MSSADSEAFVQSVVAAQPRFSLNDVVVCVDWRENRPYTDRSTREKHVSLLDAMGNVTVRNATHSVLRAHMDVGDAIVLRVVTQRSDLPSSAPIDANVSVEGAAISTLLANPGATQFVAITVYERKNVDTDFVSSIRPKSNVPVHEHLDSQIKRMCSFAAQTGARPYMLLEGYLPHAEAASPLGGGRMIEEEAHSRLQWISYNFGITIWNSANTTDSARTLHKEARMATKFAAEPKGWVRLGDGSSDKINIEVRKSANHDARAWYLACLQAIPQMSEERAVVVAAKYPTWRSLFYAYDDCASLNDRRMLVEPLTTSRPQRRGKAASGVAAARKMQKLGKALSRKLSETVYDVEDDGEVVISRLQKRRRRIIDDDDDDDA